MVGRLGRRKKPAEVQKEGSEQKPQGREGTRVATAEAENSFVA